MSTVTAPAAVMETEHYSSVEAQGVPAAEPPGYKLSPLGEGPPPMLRSSGRRVCTGQGLQCPVQVALLAESPGLVDVTNQAL